MYVKSFDGYDNGMELLTKFGVRSLNEITSFRCPVLQFETYYAQYQVLLSTNQRRLSLSINTLRVRPNFVPKKVTLLYFPFDDGIFEIKYVQFDQPFFQFGKGYIYELQCEKFEYSGEDFSTGYPGYRRHPGRSGLLPYRVHPPRLVVLVPSRTRNRSLIYDVSGIENPDLNVPNPVNPFTLYNNEGYWKT